MAAGTQTRRRSRSDPPPDEPILQIEAEDDPVQRLLRSAPPSARRELPPPSADDQDEPDPAEDLNGVTHLPPSPSVGGAGNGYEGMSMQDAALPGVSPASFTRAVTPPILAAVASHPGVAQWRVWREQPGGQRSYLGEMAASTPPDEMMRVFLPAMPLPGEVTLFFLRGVDPAGREVGVEVPHRIDGASPVLARLRSPAANGVPVGASASSTLEPVLALVKDMREADQERIRALEARLQQQADALSEERKTLAEQHAQLANNSASGVQAVAERMMEADAKRQHAAQEVLSAQNQQTLTALANIFQMGQTQLQANMAAAQQAHQQRMDEERAARERERAEWDRKRQEERDENTRRDAEREADRQRQHELRLAEMEKSAQRDREHAERMAAMMKQESFEGIAKKAAGLAGMFGFDLKDVVGRVLGGGGEGGSIADAITTGVTKLAEVAGDVIKERMRIEASVAGSMEEEVLVQQVQPTPPPLIPVQPAPTVPAAPTVPSNAIPDTDPALASVGLPVRRNARLALRAMVKSIKEEPNPLAWKALVTSAWQAEPAIYHYCKAVTVKRALLEAGVPLDQIDAVLASPMMSDIPADVPRA